MYTSLILSLVIFLPPALAQSSAAVGQRGKLASGPYNVIAACGEPQRKWMKATGRGEYEVDTWYLWYPKASTEIVITGGAWSGNIWVFAGAYPSPMSQSIYSAAELEKRMPCMKPWADAWTEAAH
jgi:hypothetical protein